MRIQVKTTHSILWYVRHTSFAGSLANEVTVFVLLGLEGNAKSARFFVAKNRDLAAHFRVASNCEGIGEPPNVCAYGYIEYKFVEKYDNNLGILRSELDVQLKGDTIMGATFYAVVLSATLLLAGSWRVAAQDALLASEPNCTPTSGRYARASCPEEDAFSAACTCMSTNCQLAVQRFCRRPPGPPRSAPAIFAILPHATFGSISTCLKPHVDEASASCKSALAFMASPAASRN